MKRLVVVFCFSLFFVTTNAQQVYPNVQYNEELKQLFIFVERKPMLKVAASSFAFHPELIVAQEATIVLYLDSDSIYHPCAEFTYNPFTTELWISRTVNGLGRAPFFDSYHKLEIKSDAIFWKMNTTEIQFRQRLFEKLIKSAYFFSQDFFDPAVMRQNKGYNDKNPMLQLWELFKAHSFQPIQLAHLLNDFRRPKTDVISLLIDYAVQGFVDFDPQQEIVSYKSKLAHFLNNESKKRDYDNLFWESKSHFATLNMDNFDLTIYDCDFFVLSDANIVNVYPASEKVTVKKNRDLFFSGRVIGGLFDFIAIGCSFDYDKFQIFMPRIDSIIIYMEDKTKKKDIYGDYSLIKVKNMIENVSGTLFIDDPKNKSGNRDVPDYPIFESREGGKVYFDRPYILNAEYKRDTFYFMIDYFVIKNLDNFNIAETKIPGRLVSGGIFPDIHEPLKLQLDYSLGFIHLTDSLGIPMYGGIAHYYNAIDLSNYGLRGKGKIKYLTSTLESDSLVFFPLYVRGQVNSFSINPLLSKIEYPPTSIKHALLFFEPYNKQMYISSQKTPFAIYKECSFEGKLALSPEKLTGSGRLSFNNAELESKLITLKHHAVEAQDASFRILDKKNENLHCLTANHYEANVNFETRKADFKSENFQEVRFVNNGFKTDIKAFSWNSIDKSDLTFRYDDPYRGSTVNNTPTRELVKMNSKENQLSTIEKGRRGTSFNLQELDFDFDKYELVARGVRYIPVGDAAIFPENGKIVMSEKTNFQQLKNSKILASRDNMFHELYNCSVKIENGDDFKGSGYYDYVDANEDMQTLRFDTIWYFKATKGTASVKHETDFTLSPHFSFSGEVELNSIHEFLTFSGAVSMIHNCDSYKPKPLRVNQQIDPKNILIEINNKSRDMDNRVATAAVASSNETGRIYTRFGGAKDQINDSEYITASGFITYNNNKQAFQAASLEKLNNSLLPGNIISLYNKDCISVGEGAIDIGAKLGRVNFNTFGQVINYIHLDSAIMRLTTSIDFFFNDEAMKIMNEYFTNAKDVKSVHPDDDKIFIQSLINILGQKEYEKYRKESASGIQLDKLPEKFDVKFLFSTLDFVWSKENAAFESKKTLPLVFSGGKAIYKEIPGRIVIEKKGSKNTLYIYFEMKNDFFFFQFENNTLSVFSSDEKFNNAIDNTKAKNKTLTSKDGLSSFTYKLGNRGLKTRFTRKYY